MAWEELKARVKCDVQVESLGSSPDLGETVRKAGLAMRVQDYSTASRVLTEAISHAGAGEGAHILYDLRAACALHARQPQQALDDALLCTKLAPHWARGWARLGEAQLCMGHAHAAAAAYLEGLRLDPSSEELRAGAAFAERAERAEGAAGDRRRAQHHT